MTLGESLILIAVLVLGVLGIKYISERKKWGIVVKIVSGIFLVGVLIGVSVWGWEWYQDRPQQVNTLGVLSLGMTPVEVSLAAGKPNGESEPTVIGGSRRYVYNDYSGELQYFVKFTELGEDSVETVDLICTRNYFHKVFGLGKYSSEDDVKKKLGEPTSQSIRKDGLAKTISYEKWKVAFEIEKKEVIGVCISATGRVDFVEEYGSQAS